jgi:hypothetical protein
MGGMWVGDSVYESRLKEINIEVEEIDKVRRTLDCCTARHAAWSGRAAADPALAASTAWSPHCSAFSTERLCVLLRDEGGCGAAEAQCSASASNGSSCSNGAWSLASCACVGTLTNLR